MIQVLVYFLWAASGCLLAAAASELAARWWLRYRSFYSVWPPGTRLLLELDPAVFPGFPSPVRFDVNRDGERGEEVPRNQSGLYRVLTAGGSIVECYMLDQPVSWPGALQRLLSQPENLQALGASRVHVGNMGCSGVGSQELRLAFARVLPRYPRLDLIIIMVGMSDIMNWLAIGAPESLATCSTPLSDIFACHPEGPFARWRPRKLALAEILRRFKLRYEPAKTQRGVGKSLQKWRAMRDRAKEVRTAVPHAAGMLDNFETNFRTLLYLAKTRAQRVLVVHQPWWDKELTAEEQANLWVAPAGRPWKEEVSVYYSFGVVTELLARLEVRTVRVAEELRVEHVALMPVLDRNDRTFYDSIHLTPLGAARVAEALAAAIARERTLPSKAAQSADAVVPTT